MVFKIYFRLIFFSLEGYIFTTNQIIILMIFDELFFIIKDISNLLLEKKINKQLKILIIIK